MTTPFPIVEVDSESAYDLEQLGTKRKFWFRRSDQTRWLFKAEERSTGEDWAEKIACELCAVLGIPHVHYELAIETDTGTPGVVCPNMAMPPLTLVLGNQLLLERDATYPAEESQKFGVREHSVTAVVEAVGKLEAPPALYCASLPIGISSALDVFVGYVMLDALVANQDRHHQNWGALRNQYSMLAPTFDHGASLARNEPEEKRKRRLYGKDQGFGIDKFATKARSGFFGGAEAKHPLSTLDAFHAFSALNTAASGLWLDRLKSLTLAQLEGIVERIPGPRMSPVTREFTVRLVQINQSRLLGR